VHTTTSRHEPNENIYEKNQDDVYQPQDEDNQNRNAIAGGTLQMNSLCYKFTIRLTYFRINSDSGNNLKEATESMVGKVERTALIVDDVDLEVIFEEYRSECENNFE
jgi:hypothetical protein